MRPSGIHRIFLYDQHIDMRKSFEGLSHLIEASYPGKLLTGALFLFLNRRRNLIKILYWEATALSSGTNAWNRAPSLAVSQVMMNCRGSNSPCCWRVSFPGD